ncbi:unnamed protein product [Sphagnum balticum]
MSPPMHAGYTPVTSRHSNNFMQMDYSLFDNSVDEEPPSFPLISGHRSALQKDTAEVAHEGVSARNEIGVLDFIIVAAEVLKNLDGAGNGVYPHANAGTPDKSNDPQLGFIEVLAGEVGDVLDL